MKKAVLLLACVLSMVTLFVANVGCSDQSDSTDEQVQKRTVEFTESAEEYYQNQIAKESKETAIADTVEWLRQQEDVVDAGEGSGCIWYQLNSGVKGLIITDSEMTR